MDDWNTNGAGPDRRTVLAGAGALGSLALAARPAIAGAGDASHDVVIVGGGSAGSVLAHRLSADPSRRVLLVEAGKAYAPSQYPDPVRLQTIIGGDPEHDWGYRSEPGWGGRSLATPRGKVLGGSSAVNAGVAMRAPPADFERWARDGLRGWSFADVLPFYKRSERTAHGSDAFHGRTGPWPIHQLGDDEISDMQRAFIASCVAAGLTRTDDFNGADPYGAAPYPMNNRVGNRLNTGMTYMSDAVRARPNLTILGETLVDRVEIAKGRAVAVVLASGRRLVGGEIILSAGAYGTPAILMRSGVGPASDLGALGIPVAADLPVGTRLQDHPFYMMGFAARPERLGLPYPSVGAMLVGQSQRAEGSDRDLQVSAVHYGEPKDSPTGAIFKLAIANVRPTARGSVRLRDRNPATPPRIALNLLGEQIDRDRLVDGVELIRRIVRAGPLSEIIAMELQPGRAASGRAAIERALPMSLEPFHHPTSTAPMGADGDPHAVVDPEGRVRGIASLRVIDASIFPGVPSTAINPTVIMTAEKLADRLTRA